MHSNIEKRIKALTQRDRVAVGLYRKGFYGRELVTLRKSIFVLIGELE